MNNRECKKGMEISNMHTNNGKYGIIWIIMRLHKKDVFVLSANKMQKRLTDR